MPSLRELQRDFAAQILAVQTTGEPHETPAHWAGFNIRGEGLSAELRLQVYRNNFYVSLTGALIAVYPVIQKLVGEAYFAQAARRYLREHPSPSGDIHDFGASFAEFLSTLPELGAHPYMPDVARLEWGYHEVFHAPDVRATIDPAQLAQIDDAHWGRTQFVLHPAVRLAISHYPVLSIWQSNQDGADGSADLAVGGEQLLIARNGLDVELRPISLGEYTLLSAFNDGRVLASAFEQAQLVEPGFDLAESLSRFIQQGVFVALRCPDARVPPRHLHLHRS